MNAILPHQGPFLGDVAHRQIDRLVGREITMIARDLTQRHVDRLNSIRRVDDRTNIGGEGKERD